jgi:Tol biopolymer transport system component
VAVAERAPTGSWLGRYDTRTGSYRRLVRAPVEHIVVAPVGNRIAFETGPTDTPDDPHSSDVEIAVVSADGGAHRRVTVNALPDELAGWSRDGKRLYFHQGNRDPDGHRYDNRVWWVEP